MISRTPLTSGWTVTGQGETIPEVVASAGRIAATVPGAVHTDLLAAGLIADPYRDDNEALQRWIGLSDWTYRTTLTWDPDGTDRQELVFDGLDTIASISLNDELLATTRNMHRSYRMDVTGRLRAGANALVVSFSSPVKEADRASLELGARPHVNRHPYNAIRKMACSYGWDWGIDTATSGIWRPVRLETWTAARLAAVQTSATYDDERAALSGRVTLDRVADVQLSVIVEVANVRREFVVAAGETTVTWQVDVPGAEPWWPTGHGAPVLHDLRIGLQQQDELLDKRSLRIGFRSVEVTTPTDSTGAGFEIRVNGELVLIRGANWIPDDAFLHRVDRARYARRLEQAEFANINLIRVWGGGVYESDDFYAECDERGLLAWQDFLFACAAYSEEEPLASEVAAEAREAILRLGSHPSLVVLNGNNENIWGRQEWGWDAPLEGRTWGAGYYYDVLPALVTELAPHVAYTPGSPFSPDREAAQNDSSTGTVHIWDLWNQKDYPHYRDYRPRFVAEFGWQGPPTWSTLVESISDSPLTPESPGMIVHQKAEHGNTKLAAGLVGHFPLPNDMETWHWAMSLNQAVAVRTAVEYFRSLTPSCTGSIVWQLNDCWPVTSWAAVDGAGRRKPLLFALQQAHSPRLVTVQPSLDDSKSLRVALVNDTTEAWDGDLVLERRTYAGIVLAQAILPFELAQRAAMSMELPAEVTQPGDANGELLVISQEEQRGLWFFTDYRDSSLEEADLEVLAEALDDGWIVDVTARVLVRDVSLLVDRVEPDAVVDKALITLLPGETVRFTIRGALAASPERFADRSILRSANELLRPRKLAFARQLPT